MTAYANVSRLYGHKKVAQAKEIKTVQVCRVTFRLAFLLAISSHTNGFSPTLNLSFEIVTNILLVNCTVLYYTVLYCVFRHLREL